MDGSDGAIAMSPMVETPSLSNTGCQVVPLFVDFQTPPDAAPTNTTLGLLSTTAKSSMRPPITAGPISRNSRPFHLSVVVGVSAGPAKARGAAASTQTINKIRANGCLHGIRLFLLTKLGMIPPLKALLHLLFRRHSPQLQIRGSAC